MDLKSGLIEINGEIFTPGYTFENFQKSTFFEGQDGVLSLIHISEPTRP